jgi:hypothetical protein
MSRTAINTESKIFVREVIDKSDNSTATKEMRICFLSRFNLTKDTFLNILENTELIKTESPNTYLTRAWHIVGFLNAVKSNMENDDTAKINALIRQYMAIIQTQSDIKNKKAMNNRADDTFVPLLELQQRLNMSENLISSYMDYENYALLACYVFTPAIRNDYYDMRIIRDKSEADDEHNFIVIGGRWNYLILNDYKTVNSFGKGKVIKLNSETVLRIKYMLDQRKKHGLVSPYLFNTMFGNKLIHSDSRTTMVERIKRASLKFLGQKLSINKFRRAWETHIQSNPRYQHMTLAQRQKEHDKLLHHIGVAMLYNRVDSSDAQADNEEDVN